MNELLQPIIIFNVVVVKTSGGSSVEIILVASTFNALPVLGIESESASSVFFSVDEQEKSSSTGRRRTKE